MPAHFITGVTGKDWLAYHFMPERARIRYFARRFAAVHNLKGDVKPEAFVFVFPSGKAYTILNANGDTAEVNAADFRAPNVSF